MSFEALALLLLPADDPSRGRVARAGEDWRLDPSVAAGAEVLIWGRGPLPSGTDPARAIRGALARERALLGLARRPPRGFSGVRVHRLPPPRLFGGGLRNAARSRLLEGAIVELFSGPPRDRVLDRAAAAAGWVGRVERFRPGSGGALIVNGLHGPRSAGGSRIPAVLRVAGIGGPGDPSRSADALRHLHTSSIPDGTRRVVPRLLAGGASGGASWTVESTLPGRRPAALGGGLTAEAVGFAAGLPRQDGPAVAHRHDIRHLSNVLPARAGSLAGLAGQLDDAARGLPAVTRHGDLWTGNLLTTRGRLTGVVDWDAWSPAALPGTDPLHLVATDRAFRARRDLGAEWLRGPWRSEEYRAATERYWAAFGLRPSGEQLEAVGAAWWAAQVSATLARVPERLSDDRWLTANVAAVLRAMEA